MRVAQRLDQALRLRGISSRIFYRHGETPKFDAERLEFCDNRLRKTFDWMLEKTDHKLASTPGNISTQWRPFSTKLPREIIETTDIVHMHWTSKWFDFESFFGSIPETIPVVWTVHDVGLLTGGCCLFDGCHGFETGCETCPELRVPWFSFLTRNEWQRKRKVLGKHRHYLVANSSWTQEKAARPNVFSGIENVTVIHPSVDTAIFRSVNRDSVRSELGISPSSFVVGFGCAALTDPNKGFSAFAEIVNGLKTDQGISVLVFGEGNIPEFADNVEVVHVGKVVSEQRLAEIYSAMDLFFVTSKMETFCQVAIEAQACGTPVCAFDAGGIGDAIEHEVTGMLFEVGDTRSVRSFVEQFRSRPDLRGLMQRSGPDFVRSRFSVETMCDRYMDVYQMALTP